MASAALGASWSSTPVGTFIGDGVVPQVVVDHAGAVHVVATFPSERWAYFTNDLGAFGLYSVPGFIHDPIQRATLLLDPQRRAVIFGSTLADSEFLEYLAAFATRDAGAFVTHTLPSDSFFRSRVYLDSTGALHVLTPRDCTGNQPPCSCDSEVTGSYLVHQFGPPDALSTSEIFGVRCGYDATDVAAESGPDGSVHVAWMATPSRGPTQVRYAVRRGAQWSESLIAKVDPDSPDFSQSLDLAVDSTSTPHIVFFNAGSRRLQVIYTTRRGKKWLKKSAKGQAAYPSIAIGPNDAVHIAYDVPISKSPGLRHWFRTGARWTTETITALHGDVPTAVFASPDGGVHVAYHDEATQTLYYAYRPPS